MSNNSSEHSLTKIEEKNYLRYWCEYGYSLNWILCFRRWFIFLLAFSKNRSDLVSYPTCSGGALNIVRSRIWIKVKWMAPKHRPKTPPTERVNRFFSSKCEIDAVEFFSDVPKKLSQLMWSVRLWSDASKILESNQHRC